MWISEELKPKVKWPFYILIHIKIHVVLVRSKLYCLLVSVPLFLVCAKVCSKNNLGLKIYTNN